MFPPPAPTPEVKWFYMSGDESKGPFKEEEMRQFAEEGAIKADTQVWNDHPQNSARGWIAASKSELSDLYPALPPSFNSRKAMRESVGGFSLDDMKGKVMPFFKGSNISVDTPFGAVNIHDKYLWGMFGTVAAVFILHYIMFFYLRFMMYIISLIAIGLLLWLADKDMKLLEAAGLLKFKRWVGFVCAFFTPFYLYRRASCTGQKRTQFFAWIPLAILQMVVFFAFQYPIISIELNAPTEVSRIIAEDLDGSARCTKVSVVERLSSKKYKGTALLDNGNAVKIDITMADDTIYVEIPLDQFAD
jgi:hypothetical protein